MTDRINDLLADLHAITISELLTRIKSGQATATELNVARQMLKDNNITAIIAPDSPLQNLENELMEYDSDVDNVVSFVQ